MDVTALQRTHDAAQIAVPVGQHQQMIAVVAAAQPATVDHTPACAWVVSVGSKATKVAACSCGQADRLKALTAALA